MPIDIECPICLDPVALDNPDAADADGMLTYPCATSDLGPDGCAPACLQCGHLFHRRCIGEWTKNRDNPSCPSCRGPVQYWVHNPTPTYPLGLCLCREYQDSPFAVSVKEDLSALFTKISDYIRNNIDPDRLDYFVMKLNVPYTLPDHKILTDGEMNNGWPDPPPP